jgi:hypothetical protein
MMPSLLLSHPLANYKDVSLHLNREGPVTYVGEYSGLLGEYCGLVAEYDGPEPGLRGEVLLLYTGLVGEYDGLVGDVGLVGLKLGEVGE